MTRKRLIRWLISLVVLAAFIIVGHKFLDERFLDAFRRLGKINPFWILAVAACYLFTRALNGEVMRLMLVRLGHSIPRREAFAMLMIKTYTNLVVSKAGAGTAAAYLKLRHGVRLTDFGSVMFAVTVLQLICIGIVGLLSQLGLLLIWSEPLQLLISLAFVVLIAGGVTCLFLRLPVPLSWQGRIGAMLHRLNEGWGLISRDRATLIRLLNLQVVILLLRALRLYMVFYALGFTTVNPVGILVGSLLGDLGLMVSITPMGLGFREAAVGYSAAVIGIDPQAAMAVTLVDRVIWSVAAAIVAQCMIWFVIKPPPK